MQPGWQSCQNFRSAYDLQSELVDVLPAERAAFARWRKLHSEHVEKFILFVEDGARDDYSISLHDSASNVFPSVQSGVSRKTSGAEG